MREPCEKSLEEIVQLNKSHTKQNLCTMQGGFCPKLMRKDELLAVGEEGVSKCHATRNFSKRRRGGVRSESLSIFLQNPNNCAGKVLSFAFDDTCMQCSTAVAGSGFGLFIFLAFPSNDAHPMCASHIVFVFPFPSCHHCR